MVILPEVCPNAHLEFMCGLAGVTIVAACLIGPVLGGVITNYISWRWIFWIKYIYPSNTPDCEQLC